jgi:DNA-binding beta-propeller fold protein YncE
MPGSIGRRGRLALAVLLAVLSGCGAPAARSQPAPLVLESTIVLKDVVGRIDHLAVDPVGRRLYVAELGNGTVDAIDLDRGAVVGRIRGLSEPQGVAFLAARGELAVASGGDGSLRFFRTADLAPVGSVALGSDADNVRQDRDTGRVVVGFGSGALAVVDPATRRIVSRVALPVHPEGFQLQGGRAYVNLPDAGRIAVMDLASGRELSSWPNDWRRFNFPLALDPQAGLAATAYRLPGTLAVLDLATGARRQTLGACGDADDLFFDGARKRLYVICGSGSVDVFEATPKGYARLARIPSRAGARTGIFAPQLDRLFVAARAASGSRDAAILVFRPAP